MLYEKHLQVIDEKEGLLRSISDQIWDLAELPYDEYQSSKLLCDTLEQEGFTVTRGVAGIPTAFTATYGTEGPSLGVLAEYDALSGFSQVGELGEKKSIPGKDSAHGCGHNLFAAGSLAAIFLYRIADSYLSLCCIWLFAPRRGRVSRPACCEFAERFLIFASFCRREAKRLPYGAVR